jgi:ferric-dicitrate binding protein FerR (iron transport regulator)
MLRSGVTVLVALCLLLAPVSAAEAQNGDVGRAEEVSGSVTRQRGGTAEALVAGAGIRTNDLLAAGSPGSARIVFIDETVLFVAEGTEIRVDEMVYQPESGSGKGALDLLRGKVRTFVSEHYDKPTAALEVRTATATAGVRGTDFIVAFDGGDTTDVAVVAGQVRVGGAGRPASEEVLVEAGQTSRIVRGRAPTSPRALTAAEFGSFLEGVDAEPDGGVGLDAAEEDDEDVDEPGPGTFEERAGRIRDGRRELGDLLEGSPAVGAGGLRVEF